MWGVSTTAQESFQGVPHSHSALVEPLTNPSHVSHACRRTSPQSELRSSSCNHSVCTWALPRYLHLHYTSKSYKAQHHHPILLIPQVIPVTSEHPEHIPLAYPIHCTSTFSLETPGVYRQSIKVLSTRRPCITDPSLDQLLERSIDK